MSTRSVYGNTWSSNGWPMVDTGSCTWVNIPGTSVTLQIQNGQPLAILRAFAADFNAYVETLRDADSACWTATNSVSTSNHLSGTAMDLNWNSHPFQVPDAGFDAAKIATVRELEDFYEGTVFWGNDWSSPKDAMHFQLASLANGGNINTYGNPAVADFIARKIRADGYSTFRRGGTTVPADAVALLAKAMSPTSVGADRFTALLPEVVRSWDLCGANTVERRAMWCAQVGTESGGLRYQEEIADGSAYEGRTDLGNMQPGDGKRFKGRDFIQITGRANYTALSKWAYGKGIVPTNTFFVDNPGALATDQYAFVGVTWYWTVARNMNAYADQRDILGATKAVNGGTNGLTDRTTRWNNALAMGDQLMQITATSTDPIEELLMSDLEVESLSLYATPGEPNIPIVRIVQAIDAAAHRELVENAARLGDTDSLQRIARVAAGQGKYKDAGAIAHAKAVLAQIEATNPAVLQGFINSQNGASA